MLNLCDIVGEGSELNECAGERLRYLGRVFCELIVTEGIAS